MLRTSVTLPGLQSEHLRCQKILESLTGHMSLATVRLANKSESIEFFDDEDRGKKEGQHSKC